MPEPDEFKLFRNKHPEAQEWLRRILAFAGDNHNTKLLPCRDQPGAQPTFMVMEHKYFTFSGINLRVPSITMTFYQEPHRYPGILTAEQIAAVEFRHSGQNLSKAKVTDAQHVGFVCLLVDHTWKLKRLNRVRWHDLPSGEAEWEGRITFRDHQNAERTFRDYCRASSADAAKASFSADHAALKVIQIEVRRLPPVAPWSATNRCTEPCRLLGYAMTISELARNLEVLSRCHDLPRDEYESGDNSPDELSPSTITEIARNVTRPESWDIAPQPVTEALVKAVRCACRRLISSYAGFRTWQAHEAASFLHQIEMLIHDVHADRSIPVHIALLGAGFGKLSRTVGEPSVAHAAIEHLLSQDPAVVNGPLLKALAVSELVHDWHGAWYAIENDPDRPVAWNAAQALILLANAQNRPLEVPLVFEVLTEALDAGYEYGFDADVVFLFIKAGPVCITFAEKVLWSDNCHISYQGVEILSHFSQRSNAEATKALIEFVNRRPHDYAFPYAAGALANNPDPDAQLALLQAWVNDDHYERNCRGESWYTRRYFAEKFGETLVEKIIDTGASSSSVLARLNEVADFQIGQLIPLVRHPNANVRATLAEIVSSRREEPECQVIITALASDPDPRVREMLLAE